MPRTNPKLKARSRRKKSIRKKISGTPERPRMSVFRSNKHIYVQVVDDVTGQTLAAASTLSAEVKSGLADDKKIDQAKKVGALAAQKCLDKNIAKVVFDRNGFGYCGRVAAVAAAAREGGLKF